MMKIVFYASLMIVSFCSFVGSIEFTWPETNFKKLIGHYPSSYCGFTDVVLSPSERAFLYRSDEAHHSNCMGVADIWPIQNVKGTSLSCDEIYDNGHVFTIYYWYGGSNYFHLHYDLLIPLYLSVHHNRQPSSNPRAHIFMPTVESRRLQFLDWSTKAFMNHDKFWVQMSKAISIPYTYAPVEESLLIANKSICFRNIQFGTPSIQFSNSELMNGFVNHMQKVLNVTVQPFEMNRIGVISRSNRRRMLNEDELIEALNKIALTEKLEFSGMSFRDQVALMQRYTVLVGVNGAGLTNALYLPPYAVAVQIVPFKAQVNFREFGVMLKTRGPYLEWHNTHENLTRVSTRDVYNNNADTIVHIDEFKKVIYDALEMSDKARLGMKKTLHEDL